MARSVEEAGWALEALGRPVCGPRGRSSWARALDLDLALGSSGSRGVVNARARRSSPRSRGWSDGFVQLGTPAMARWRQGRHGSRRWRASGFRSLLNRSESGSMRSRRGNRGLGGIHGDEEGRGQRGDRLRGAPPGPARRGGRRGAGELVLERLKMARRRSLSRRGGAAVRGGWGRGKVRRGARPAGGSPELGRPEDTGGGEARTAVHGAPAGGGGRKGLRVLPTAAPAGNKHRERERDQRRKGEKN